MSFFAQLGDMVRGFPCIGMLAELLMSARVWAHQGGARRVRYMRFYCFRPDRMTGIGQKRPLRTVATGWTQGKATFLVPI